MTNNSSADHGGGACVKKVAALLLRYDYGIPSRGISMERRLFVPAMEKVFDTVSCFWLEDNGFPDDLKGLQARALEFVKRESPDLAFFILMRGEIRPETLRAIREVCPTANWFCDDQWRFDEYSSRLAPILTWAVTTDKFAIPKYESIGGAKPILTQWGAEDRIDVLDLDSVDYEFDTTFVGSANATRRWFIDELRKTGVKVECFGSGWSNGRVDACRMNEIFLRSRVNLNLSNSMPSDPRFSRYILSRCVKSVLGLTRKEGKRYRRGLSESWYDLRELMTSVKRIEQVKARCFEIPAAGGFQLCRYALGLEDSFIPGKEIAVFTDVRELGMSVRYYLERAEERKSICRAGYERSARYRYVDRFNAIKAAMEAGNPDRESPSTNSDRVR